MTDYISDGCFVLFSAMWPLSSELENSVLFWFFFCGFGEEPQWHWSSRQGQIQRIRLDGEGQGHPGGACGWGLPWIAQGLCLLPWLTQVKAYDLEVPLTIQHHLLAPGGLESLFFLSLSANCILGQPLTWVLMCITGPWRLESQHAHDFRQNNLKSA